MVNAFASGENPPKSVAVNITHNRSGSSDTTGVIGQLDENGRGQRIVTGMSIWSITNVFIICN
jgi:hypothetical protein